MFRHSSSARKHWDRPNSSGNASEFPLDTILIKWLWIFRYSYLEVRLFWEGLMFVNFVDGCVGSATACIRALGAQSGHHRNCTKRTFVFVYRRVYVISYRVSSPRAACSRSITPFGARLFAAAPSRQPGVVFRLCLHNYYWLGMRVTVISAWSAILQQKLLCRAACARLGIASNSERGRAPWQWRIDGYLSSSMPGSAPALSAPFGPVCMRTACIPRRRRRASISRPVRAARFFSICALLKCLDESAPFGGTAAILPILLRTADNNTMGDTTLHPSWKNKYWIFYRYISVRI